MKLFRFIFQPFFILIILFFNALVTYASQEITEAIKKGLPSTVLIVAYDNDGKILSQGSGFFISKAGDIITNYHVIVGASKILIKTFDKKIYRVNEIVAENRNSDIIRIKANIRGDKVNNLFLNDTLPEIGEKIIVIGNPHGLESTVSEGIISAVRNIPDFGKIIQITAPISKGSSGSPVINMKGKVIGVASLIMVDGQNLNFVIPSKKISTLAEDIQKPLVWEEKQSQFLPLDKITNKGAEYIFKGEYSKALSYLKQALNMNPNDHWTHFFSGYCLFMLDKYREAIEAYKRAIRTKTGFAEAYCNMGLVFNELGNHSEAMNAFKQALIIKPDSADALFCLGYTLNEIDRNQEALNTYHKALKIKPENPVIHFHEGLVYAKLGNYDKAIESCQNAIKLNSNYTQAHYELGVIFLKAGKKDNAIQEHKVLKQLDTGLANKLFLQIPK